MLSALSGLQNLAQAREGAPDHRCWICRYHFSLLTGTALQASRLPLNKWVLAVAPF